MKLLTLSFILFLNLTWHNAFTQERKYTASNAHAHNDYKHPKPFFTAYDAAFGSIEADIIFRDGQLYVTHDTVGIDAGRTLQTVYLRPLSEAIKRNNGAVYKDTSKRLLLLVDIKSAAEPTLEKVIDVLSSFREITTCKTLTIVITGNLPDAGRLTSFPRYIKFDGNLKLNYEAEALDRVALFSDNFKKYSKWNGTGSLNELDKTSLSSAVQKAHALNKPIRFWGAPDAPDAWRQLMKLDVDYINTDKIQQMSTFLQ